MRKKWIYVVQIVLSLAVVCGLATSCGEQSATSPPTTLPPPPTATPPASVYPADISGKVTIAEKVRCFTMIPVPPQDESAVFWIMDISVRNASYENAMTGSLDTGHKGWELLGGDDLYRPTSCGRNEPVIIPPGDSGRVMLYFAVPSGLKMSDAKIRYSGQEPYSYGPLTGGHKVVAYDWLLKTAITEPEAVVVAEDWKIQLDGRSWKGSTVTVELTITNLGPRRNLGLASLMDAGPELVAIDSTEKIVEPWVPEPDISEGELLVFPPYTREFYPNESWSGSLKFEMSPYSGETGLYMTRFYHQRRYFLFDLGSPSA